MVNEIEITPQPLTGIKRKVRRFQTITHEDGELSIVLKVIFLDQNGNDLVESFRGMIGTGEDNISPSQFKSLEKKFHPYLVEHHTKGSFVDNQGNVVEQDTEGAVREIDFLRNLSVNTHLIPMLLNYGLIEDGEDRHIAIEEAYEKLIMLRMDALKRY
jgi:hypothetical protein